LDEAGMVLLDPRSVSEELLYKSRYDTMTLDTGLIGKIASTWQSIPILGRVTLPFSTAPTNEILRALERLPIPMGSKRVYQDLLGQNGPKAQQLALGRWSMGSMTFAYVGSLATEGRITGATPNDAKERQALPPGWQPYSFVLRGDGFPVDADGDALPLYDEYGRPNGPLTYVNYAGYGPYSSVVGLAATIPQSLAMARDPQHAQNLGAAALGAVVEYYKNLPMLQGIAQMMEFADGVGPEGIVRSPASAATPLGVPNIYSSLQRGITRGIDPTRVTPRDAVEYYTMADADAGHASDDPLFSNPDGSVSYRLVGSPKSDVGQKMREVWTMMRAYQQQDSMFADEKDLNAIQYDTLGNAIGAEDVSFAARPGLAIWNLTTGVIVKPGRELTAAEGEMMRLAKDVGGWPISNPDSISSIKLSAGAKSDLTRIAKNEVTLNLYGSGFADFRGALEQLIFTPEYSMMTDAGKRNMVRNLNSKFVDAGIETLLLLPEYANLAQAYQDVKSLKEQGLK